MGCFILNSILNRYNEKVIIENYDHINNILDTEENFINHFDKALIEFEKMVKKLKGMRRENVNRALKSTELDDRIIKQLREN